MKYRIVLSFLASVYLAGCGAIGERVDSTALCGDGLVQDTEQCDDLNTASGDGCSRTCKVEAGFLCRSEPSECEPSVCNPTCGDSICGDDGCGGSCGECVGLAECIEGQCVDPCEPQCENLECGDDGCGGFCGTCEMGEECVDGLCKVECVPDCIDRTCGTDGCEGSCGECDTDFVCSSDGICIADTSCPEGQVTNCEGGCTYETWLNDGWCDTVLDCAELNFDNGDCDSGSGGNCDETQVVNCDGGCTSSSWLADGMCDTVLNCAAHGYDAGDCPLPCADGEVMDCNATCVADTLMGDGTCQENLECEQLAWDNGDCSPPTCEDEGEHTDCVGTCFPDSYLGWIGDGYCDDGAFGLDINCAAWNFDGGDCGTPGDPCWQVVCDTGPEPACEGNDAVTYNATGTCVEGTCVYAETDRIECGEAGVCTLGVCLDANDPCAGVICDSPPDPLCDGQVAVQYEADGTCDTGVCSYTPIPETCGEGMICDTGTCVQDPATMSCSDHGGVDSFISDGDCDSYNNIVGCNWDGGDCCESTCVDASYICGDFDCQDPTAFENAPCLDAVCESPPDPVCDGNEVITFDDDGVCNESNGNCDYAEATRVDCGADICTSGVCVDAADPCAGMVCDSPPSDFCTELVATRYESSGSCVPDSEGVGVCNYVTVEETCGDGMMCEVGVCVADPLQQSCSEAGGIDSYVGDGYCDSSSNIINCTWDGGDCCESTCQDASYTCGVVSYNCLDPAASENDPCNTLVCETAPDTGCDAGTNEIVTYESSGVCDQGNCVYAEAGRTACGSQVCSNGTCVAAEDPCAGISCNLPPSPGCNENLTQNYPSIGTCADDGSGVGLCTYVVTEVDCGASQLCLDGACVSCTEAGAITDCNGECELSSLLGDGTCDENLNCEDLSLDNADCCEEAGLNTSCNGACFSDSYLSWLGDGYCDDSSLDLNCAEWNYDGGDCGTPPDPCWQVACESAPEPACDGNDVLTLDDGGTCIEGTCVFDEASRVDCGDTATCTTGECVANSDPCAGMTCNDPPAGYCVGDIAITHAAVGECSGGSCDYEESEETCGETTTCTDGACISNCSDGYIPDCNGNCGPQSWLDDGWCDDGAFSSGGVPIYFNCDEFNNDEGDCD